MVGIIKLNCKVVASFGLESTIEMVCTGEFWKVSPFESNSIYSVLFKVHIPV